MSRDAQRLPCDIIAESFVLGSILWRPEFFDRIDGAVGIEDFSIETHQTIYRRMRDLNRRGETINTFTVRDEILKNGEAKVFNGDVLTFLTDLDRGLPHVEDIDSQVRIVIEKSVLRQGAMACDQMKNRFLMAGEASEEILTSAQAMIQRLTDKKHLGAADWRTPGEVMSQYPGGISAFLEPHKHANGIQTPWAALNDATGGLQEGELFVVAGRTSMGKSIIAMQIAVHAAKHFRDRGEKNGVAVFSLEMTAESLIYRLLCEESPVDAQRFRMGFLSPDERKKLNHGVGVIHDLPLWIDDTKARTAPAMISALRKLSTTRGRPRVIIVDHLLLMSSIGRAESLRIGLSEIVHTMKRIAVDFGATMVLLTQLNRDCEEGNRRPQLSDLKETGTTEEDADVVTFIHRWEQYEKYRGKAEMRGQAELILAKQRNGPTGLAKLIFIKEQQRFETAVGADVLQHGGDDHR